MHVVPEALAPGTRWEPVIGEEFLELLARQQRLGAAQKEILQRESLAVLARCAPPYATSASATGLVFGYVQSGKTLSFIATAAMARDNGFQMVIVIAGTSVPLLKQSQDRLAQELFLPPIGKNRKWWHFPSPSEADLPGIKKTLETWDDAGLPDKRKSTVLITVMKETTHLDRLVELLKKLDLSGRPVLVIDDEADQASMNANARNPTKGFTTIHRHILNLKSALPSHTLLQYTATPQAPLLVSLFDTLSPSFIRVLPPGQGYVGGAQFFEPGSKHVELIMDQSELPTNSSPPEFFPKSLRAAMRTFFLGVAAGWVNDEVDGNRSMLVHPSQNTKIHESYFTWIKSAMKDWADRLGRAESDPDRQSLVMHFSKSYQDLLITVPDLPPFTELLKQLPRAIQNTTTTLANAADGSTPSIPFNEVYSHIVVGGQAMDRGFTVEGLTVTYLPRSLGVGNADTLQQRARFFGYKAGYLGYCRVFLSVEVANAFEAYVRFEEYIREKLVEHQDSGYSLKTWRRMFILDPKLKPTRRSVLPLESRRYTFGGRWFTTLYVPHEEARSANQQLVAGLRSSLDFREWEGGPSTHPHLKASTTMEKALEFLLEEWVNCEMRESEEFLALITLAQDFLVAKGSRNCEIYLMNGLRERERSVEVGSQKLGRLFQGYGDNYAGDEKVRLKGGFTIQIHNISPKKSEEKPFLCIAVYSPQELSESMYVNEFEEVIS